MKRPIVVAIFSDKTYIVGEKIYNPLYVAAIGWDENNNYIMITLGIPLEHSQPGCIENETGIYQPSDFIVRPFTGNAELRTTMLNNESIVKYKPQNEKEIQKA